MRLYSSVPFILIFVFINSALIFAQTPIELPDQLAVITSENAPTLQSLASIVTPQLGEFAWLPDGSMIGVGTTTQGVFLFDADDITQPPIKIPGQSDILFHPAGDKIVSGGVVWDIATQQALFEVGNSDARYLSSDGQVLLTSRQNDDSTSIKLWNISTATEIISFSVMTANTFQSAIFSSDNQHYALIFEVDNPLYERGAMIQVRDTQSSAIILEQDLGAGAIEEVIFTHSNERVTIVNQANSYGATGTSYLSWNLTTGELIETIEQPYGTYAMSPNQEIIAFHDEELITVLWLEEDSQNLIYAERRVRFIDASFSPDNQYLAVSSSQFMGDVSDYNLLLWQLRPVGNYEGANITLTHQSPISQFAFSPDNSIVAVAAGETTHIWNLASQEKVMEIPMSGILSFTPDNMLIVNNQTIWDIKTGVQVNQLTSLAIATTVVSPSKLQTAHINGGELVIIDLIQNQDHRISVLDNYLGQRAQIDTQHSRVLFEGDRATVIDLGTGERLGELSDPYRDAKISTDGNSLIARVPVPNVDNLFSISIIDLDKPEQPPIVMDEQFKYPYTSLSPVDDLLFVSISDGDILANRHYLYDSTTGKQLVEWEGEPDLGFNVNSIFTQDGQYLITVTSGHRSAKLRVWDIPKLVAQDTDSLVASMALGINDAGFIQTFTLTDDQTYLVLSIDDAELGDGIYHQYRIALINLPELIAAGDEVYEDKKLTEHLRNQHSPQFIGDSEIFLTRSNSINWEASDRLTLWTLNATEPLTAIIGYTGGVISPNGDIIATYTSDEITIWDVNAVISGNKDPTVTLQTADRTIDIAFDQDGTRFYQITKDSIHIWGTVEES